MLSIRLNKGDVLKVRESNVELLRIIAIIGVIILHYNNPTIGGGLKYVENGTINFYILNIFETVFATGVNLFILISGYFLCISNKRILWKPVELIVQVILFSLGRYLVVSVLINKNFSVKSLFGSLVPDNYFVILYCVLFCISPYLNILFEKLSFDNIRKFMILIFLLFSVYPTLVDLFSEITGRQWNGLSSIGMYGSQYGYSIVNFILMYLIGAYLRKHDKFDKISNKKLLICFLAVVVVLTFWALLNDFTGYYNERSAWEYCNPLLIIETVIIFLLFRRIKIGSISFINNMSRGAFSVFLIHDLFIRHIGIEKFVQVNSILMIFHILCSAIILYVIGWLIYLIYDFVMKPFYKKLYKVIKLPVIEIETKD